MDRITFLAVLNIIVLAFFVFKYLKNNKNWIKSISFVGKKTILNDIEMISDLRDSLKAGWEIGYFNKFETLNGVVFKNQFILHLNCKNDPKITLEIEFITGFFRSKIKEIKLCTKIEGYRYDKKEKIPLKYFHILAHDMWNFYTEAVEKYNKEKTEENNDYKLGIKNLIPKSTISDNKINDILD